MPYYKWYLPEHQSSLNFVTIELIVDHWLGFSRKRKPTGESRAYFFENPWKFLFLLLKSLEISEKTKLHPWKFHKIALDPLEISRPSHQDPWKFHIIFFLVTLLNSFCYFFDTPGNSISILYSFPQPVWFSSGIAHLTLWWRPAG